MWAPNCFSHPFSKSVLAELHHPNRRKGGTCTPPMFLKCDYQLTVYGVVHVHRSLVVESADDPLASDMSTRFSMETRRYPETESDVVVALQR